jgi:predicted phosphodiesterase
MEEALRNFPEVPTRTLAKAIYKEHSKFFNDVEAVRSALRRRRGNAGVSNLKDAEFHRNNHEAGFKYQLPPSQQTVWEPYVIPNGERLAVISDVHIPYHDEEVMQQWYRDASEYEPSVIVINGDLLDFYRMSRFEKNPAVRDTAFEIDQAHEFFAWLTERFEAKIVFKEGNHDERWAKYIWNNAPEFSKFSQFSLEQVLLLEEFGVDHVGEKRIIKAGDLNIIHGHELYGGGGIQPARSMMARMNANALAGHNHRTSQFTQNNFEGNHMACYSTGCMCELFPEYSRINGWNHGYAFVDVYEDGSFDMDNRIIK